MSESEASKDSAWEGEERRKAILEQYKLYVDIADRAAARRMTANAWWMSLQTALVAATVHLWPEGSSFGRACLLPALGCLASILWLLWLLAYARVAHIKGQVIHATEEDLPWQLWALERATSRCAATAGLNPAAALEPWRFGRLGSWDMTRIEWRLPLLFFVVQLLLLLFFFVHWLLLL